MTSDSALDSGLEDLDGGNAPAPVLAGAIALDEQFPILNPPTADKGLTALGHFVARSCTEKDTAIIVKATHFLGRDQSLNYLKFAMRSQQGNSGFMTKSGNRTRTIGGMFLRLIKDDPQMDPMTVKAIFKKKPSYLRKLKPIKVGKLTPNEHSFFQKRETKVGLPNRVKSHTVSSSDSDGSVSCHSWEFRASHSEHPDNDLEPGPSSNGWPPLSPLPGPIRQDHTDPFEDELQERKPMFRRLQDKRNNKRF